MVELQAVSHLLPSGSAALHNVSFKLEAHEKIALLGANGSGKSTLAHLLTGIIAPTSGFIRWKNPPLAAQVQLLMQQPHQQVLGKTVEEELRFGPDLLGWENRRTSREIDSALAKLAVDADRELTKLSGGELQQVLTQAVTLLEPLLMIYDEPTTYLPPLRSEQYIAQVLQDERAAIWLTPSLREASQFPRIVVLEKGRVVFDGEPANYQPQQSAKPLITSSPKKSTQAGCAIVLQGITLKDDDKVRLQVDSLRVQGGECIGVLGDAGAGKTTLLSLISGIIEQPQTNRKVDADFPLRSFAFQYPELSFIETEISAEIGGPDPSQAVKIAGNRLRKVNLDPAQFLHRNPFTLSGGEARRVALAATILSDDTFLCWDEPTAGLDSDGTEAIATVLQQHPGGFVVASHDTDFLSTICDRLIGVEAGKVIFDASRKEWMVHPDWWERCGHRIPSAQ